MLRSIRSTSSIWCSIVALCLTVSVSPRLLAEGTESLGPANLPLSGGSGVVAAGVGLQDSQPGVITIDVPGDVVQVLLHWSGARPDGGHSDETINVNGVEVTGQSISNPVHFFSFSGKNFHYSSYRADITALGVVTSGINSLTIDGLNNIVSGFGENSGAAVTVIYDDGVKVSDVHVHDGMDTAFLGFPGLRQTTDPQTFVFDPASVDRTGVLIITAGSVGSADRTSVIRVVSGGVTTDLHDELSSGDGPLWDTLNLPIEIPAGAGDLTVEIISGDGTGNSGAEAASLTWIGASLAVEFDLGPCVADTDPPVLTCNVTRAWCGIREVTFDATDDCGDVTIEARYVLDCGEEVAESGDLIDARYAYCGCNVWEWCGVQFLGGRTIQLVVTATDEAGNTADCTIDLLKRDDRKKRRRGKKRGRGRRR